jgi:hypothetical protein
MALARPLRAYSRLFHAEGTGKSDGLEYLARKHAARKAHFRRSSATSVTGGWVESQHYRYITFKHSSVLLDRHDECFTFMTYIICGKLVGP